ncbi:MAG TPA: c-type cytochrome [Verrucomicrobiae bacterium]|nr:c-type cytochrome [Verrucomicrobiae bacterium]
MQELISKRFIAFWFSSVLLQLGLVSFSDGASPSSGTNATAAVHSIILPHFEPELPSAHGRDEYLVVCVSCHSPRYVTMQPLFPQRQWEETVDKMAKVYGAQMDQDQRGAIVQYLVTTHGPDSTRAPARDEDSDFASAAKPISPPETAPLLHLAADSTEHAKEVERGGELFKQNCAACHGATGRGDGFVSQVLLRKPKDLVATRFSLSLLSQVLWNGKRGTAMPSWRSLPQADLTALAAYVQNLHQPVNSDAASPESLQRGQQVFLQNCAPCHGQSGDGKGTAATTLMPEPANFKLKQPDFAYILQVLNNGIPGTGMPAWNQQISEPDRKALANFLRSLFRAESPSEH